MSESALEMVIRLSQENTERLYQQIQEANAEVAKYHSLFHFLIGWSHRECAPEGMSTSEYASYIEERCFRRKKVDNG